MLRLLLAAALILPLTARAAEPPADADKPDPELAAAKAVLKQYLDTLAKSAEGKKPVPAEVAKKLQGAKKFIHPKMLELIAGQEKKSMATLALAVWDHAKDDYWLMSYDLGDAHSAALGAVVVDAKEKNWRVQEAGEDGDPEPTSYLLCKSGGKWLVIDKRRNETFTNDAIKMGYKEYFDAAKPADAKPADAKPADAKPADAKK